MHSLTRQEVEHFIHERARAKGSMDQSSILDAWLDAVLLAIDRLELDQEHEAYRPLARRTMRFLRAFMLPASGPPEATYRFPGPGGEFLKGAYMELNSIAVDFAATYMKQVFSDAGERHEAALCMYGIGCFVGEAMETIEELEPRGTVTCTGEGFSLLNSWYCRLNSVLLGKRAAAMFKGQFDLAAGVLNEFLDVIQMDGPTTVN